MLSGSPRPVPGPSQLWAGLKAAGLVPVMARSYWLMSLMAGCDWLTLRLKFIHIVLPGCLHLAVSGEDVWPQSLSSLSGPPLLGPLPAQAPEPTFHLTDTIT